MPTYQVEGTTIQLNITEEVAEAYETFMTAVSKIPIEQLTTQFQLEGVTDRQRVLYDKYATMMNLMIELNDGGIDCSVPQDEPIRLIKI